MGGISYGEARRLLIARALIHKPQLLVFDEPTNGLDLAAAESFLETVQGLAGDGYSIVIVTHHLPEIIPAITHVGVIHRGQLERSGLKD
jgi:iron complex transport system ATP-binding protein